MNRQGKLLYINMIVVQSILYGVMDPISKMAYVILPIYEFLFIRYLLSSCIMLMIWRKQIIKELHSARITACLFPGLCMALAFIFSNLALNFTAATNVSFLRSLSALIVPILSALCFKNKYEKKEVILQIFILLGLYLLCAKGGLTRFGAGEAYALLAAALVAGALVFGQQTLHHISAVTLSFVQSSMSLIVCGVIGGMTHSVRLEGILNIQILLSLIYAAVCCTIGGYLLQNVALQHITSKSVGMLQCLYPIVTAVTAFLILGERLSVLGMTGAALIIICVFLENAIPDRRIGLKETDTLKE